MDVHHGLTPIPTIKGYSACVSTGRIFNGKTGKPLRPRLVRSRVRYYQHVRIARISYRVHRLIISAHLERPLNRFEHVRHLDGNCANNAVSNLAVGTAADNAADRIAHNTNGKVLRNNDVREIRALWRRLGYAVLAARFRVSVGHVQAIVAGRSWRGLSA